MGLSFFEGMRGHLVDRSGGIHLVDIDIKAETTHLSQLLLDGMTRITGIVRARPWAEDAPLEGTLHISPLRHRHIVYDFGFRDADGREYQFRGVKTLSLWRPLYSMTHLASTLHRGEDLLAEGELLFDLNDVLSFLGRWSLSTSVRSFDLTGKERLEGSATDILDADETRTLRAYAEAIIAPGENVPPVDDRTVREALKLVDFMPGPARAAYRGLLRALNAAAMIRHQRAFAALSLETRQGLAQWINESGSAGRGVNAALSMPIKGAHFGRRDYMDRISMPTYANPVGEPEPRWMANVATPEDLEPRTEIEADVVILGTGAGGGPMAALLAERGLAVAVLEEGRFERRPQFAGPLNTRLLKFWRDAGMTFSLGNPPIPIPTGRLVGGTTAINSGTSFSTPDPILEEWRSELGFPDDFRPEAFAPHLDAVRTELGIQPGDAAHLGDIAKIVAAGAESLGVPHGPLPRNAPACDGQGICVFGCPTDAKRSTNVSYIPRALHAGAQLFTGLAATRALIRGDRAVAVEARGQDRFGDKRILHIRARAVVIACGTLKSPLFLSDSGIDLPWLGRNLSIHPALGMLARSDAIQSPWNAIPQSYGIEGLVDERVRFEGFWAPPQFSGLSIPFIGEELTRWMDAAAQVGQYGFMVRDRNVGRIHRGLGGSPIIRYDVTADVLERFRRGSAVLAELLLRGGADEVLAGVGSVGTIHSIEEARQIAEMDLKPSDFRPMAFHPLGTCRMGPDAERSVVDFEHRVHGTQNLYVVDGSSVPTSLGVNPQVTIMAMAERAAKLLAQRLNAA